MQKCKFFRRAKNISATNMMRTKRAITVCVNVKKILKIDICYFECVLAYEHSAHFTLKSGFWEKWHSAHFALSCYISCAKYNPIRNKVKLPASLFTFLHDNLASIKKEGRGEERMGQCSKPIILVGPWQNIFELVLHILLLVNIQILFIERSYLPRSSGWWGGEEKCRILCPVGLLRFHSK